MRGLTLDILSYSTVYELETEENQLMDFALQSNSAVHGIGTRLALTEENRVGSLGLPLNMRSKHDSR